MSTRHWAGGGGAGGHVGSSFPKMSRMGVHILMSSSKKIRVNQNYKMFSSSTHCTAAARNSKQTALTYVYVLTYV